jgi:hypothetical protein
LAYCQLIADQFIKQSVYLITGKKCMILFFRFKRGPQSFPFHQPDVGDYPCNGFDFDLYLIFVYPLGSAKRPQFIHLTAKLIHHFGETDPFTAGHEFDL